jgi:hypothetical protein
LGAGAGCRRFGALFSEAQRLHARGKLAIGKDREKGAKGKGDPAQQGRIGWFHEMVLVSAAAAR